MDNRSADAGLPQDWAGDAGGREDVDLSFLHEDRASEVRGGGLAQTDLPSKAPSALRSPSVWLAPSTFASAVPGPKPLRTDAHRAEIVQDVRVEAEECYRASGDSGRGAAGRVYITLVLDGQGQVAHTSATQSGTLSKFTSTCTEARLKAKRFKTSSQNGDTLVFPVVLRSKPID